MVHIVWDWNGTLFDDVEAVVDATSEIFAPYGLGPFGVDEFRAFYTRPIWVAYERLLGRTLEAGEWERLDSAWHDSYHRLMERCALAADARQTINMLTAAGHSQSLLSMWRHEQLVPTVARLGLTDAFRRVDGLRLPEQAGGRKAGLLDRHLAGLGVDAADVLMIGDSADDAIAARQAGARAVLYAGGMTGRANLERLGVPVVTRLTDAVNHI
ncbi:MAG TPA: HAD hydrolase-like protein [Streptosporangiaceae bacterium]|jgi:phosphoglycolate phosphatase-like HAD superfamily hydrolase|nr:HAD hydrolase-like protein [Streptosporangiaceae bacterium]